MISIIVAVDKNGLIGSQGKLPWSIKSEIKHFQQVTTGGVCVFGRKTWESLPKKPLSDRVNIVVSNSMDRTNEFDVCRDIWEAMFICHKFYPNKEIFICGGRSLYEQALPFIDRIYLSCIYGDYEGDTFFPCKPSNLLYDMNFTVTQEFGTRAEGYSEAWDFYLLERHIRTF